MFLLGEIFLHTLYVLSSFAILELCLNLQIILKNKVVFK